MRNPLLIALFTIALANRNTRLTFFTILAM